MRLTAGAPAGGAWRADDFPCGFPFRGFEDRFATEVGATASQAADEQRAPGDDQVDGQAGRSRSERLEAASFHAAARFEHAEEDFDHPPPQ